MTLEGKKKFIATVTAIVASGLALFFTPEQVEPMTQMLAVMSPLVLGFIYDLLQGRHDVKKEEVKIEQEKSFQAEKAVTPPVPIEQPNLVIMADTWNLPEFAELDRRASVLAAANYFESNPMTDFFTAPIVLKNIGCVSIEQVLVAWGWYEDKAEAAFKKKFGFSFNEAEEHLADDKSCPYYSVDNMARQKSIHHWAMLRKLRAVKTAVGDLDELEDLELDWGSSLAPKDRNLFTVGNYAKYLVKNYYNRGKV